GQDEFGFETLARDYFGHHPSAQEAAGLLIKLHATPTPFYKKGKGRYKPAPAQALKSALASIERKRQQARLQEGYVESLRRFELPDEFRPLLNQLLYKPIRDALEIKALEAACAELKLSVPKLLERCGALPSSYDYHLGRFLFEYFPRGQMFDPALAVGPPVSLEPAAVAAFSIDDATTTEIDDAFSVVKLANGNWQVGVHIAAPALGVPPGSALDHEAAKRMSTVYFPGAKITMLPPEVIDRFTLTEGKDCPAMSMYAELTPDLTVVGTRTLLEQVRISHNLHHDQLEEQFNAEAIASGQLDFPCAQALLTLYRFALLLEQARGKQDNTVQRPEYSFYVDQDRVRIVPRKRGSPIDKVVSELMILVNSTWAGRLCEAQIPGLYRVQSNGKVKMSTVPAPHQGLGLDQYIWASSPLRRYADLVNQRQLASLLRGEPPVYEKSDQRLFEILRGFELAYDAYAEFQRQMERYWCLRWLVQEDVTQTTATVVRDELVRFDRIPLVCRVASLPALPPGARVEVAVSAIDQLELTLHCEHRRTLDPEIADSAAADA
ncbi:MAG: ribonuclease catalytic domain-containing protein, partial [Burkholderiales bacterium]